MSKIAMLGLKFVVLTLLGVGVLATIDEMDEAGLDLWRHRRTAATAGSDAPVYEGTGRLFVLFIDSLRAQTAKNSELMPHLVGLRKEAVYGEVDTVPDAMTAPAIRAAFTGDDRFRIFDFIKSFFSREKKFLSLFTQLKNHGATSIVYSRSPAFSQFGSDIEGRRSSRQEARATKVEAQGAQLRAALNSFRHSEAQLFVFHLSYLDDVAHRRGVGHPLYKTLARAADELVGEIKAQIGKDDSFIVFGDHGHLENGSHTLGFEVPTYILAHGPGFKQGIDLGRLPITAYRYLMSWALKLPFEGRQDYGVFAEALLASRDLPSAYKSDGSSLKENDSISFIKDYSLAFLAVLVIALALLPLWFGGEVKHKTLRKAAFAAAVAAGFFGWGFLLFYLQPDFYEIRPPTMLWLWATVLALGLVGTRRTLRWRQAEYQLTPSILAMAILSVCGLLLPPVVQRFGFAAMFAPIWLVWAIWATECIVRDSNRRESQSMLFFRRRTFLLGLLILWLVQPFFFVNVMALRFNEFLPLLTELAPKSLVSRAFLAMFASSVIFSRQKRDAASFVISIAFYLYFIVNYFRIWSAPGALAWVCSGVLIFTAFALHDAKKKFDWQWAYATSFANSLCLAGLLVLLLHLLQALPDMQFASIVLLAALRLSLTLVERLPEKQRHPAGHVVFLMALAMMFTGWVCLGWALQGLETHATYQLLAKKTFTQLSGLAPLALLKACLLVMAARLLAAEWLVTQNVKWPKRDLNRLVTLKAGSLMLITLALGFQHEVSSSYLEAAEQLAVFIVLSLGVIF